MVTAPFLAAAVLALGALWLLWRRHIRWAGVLVYSVITAFAALACGACAELSLGRLGVDPATTTGYAIGGIALAVLTLLLLLTGVWGAVIAWRR